MAIKKNELYSRIWEMCNDLRGGMEPSEYKDYILTLLFLKYISDKYKDDSRAMITIPKGSSFSDISLCKGQKDIGEKINACLENIEQENQVDWITSTNADFNSDEKLGKGNAKVDTLTRLISIFDSLDFSNQFANSDDLLGDAYEYLMRKFASQAGKSKGDFYTPSEVSRVLANVVGITKETSQDQTVYDPTCGSGSLLLKCSELADNGLSIYGQEREVASSALCRMNMFIHDNPAEIAVGGNSTLSDPEFLEGSQLKTFDFSVANPPFSSKNWRNGFLPENDEFGRFNLGIPPTSKGDFAFVLHVLASLKSTGKAAIILPHGTLFRGDTEALIRKNLILNGYLKGIIGLPLNLFYGTPIAACIMILDKTNAEKRKGKAFQEIFMIDASMGYIKDGPKNKLREQDIHKIIDIFNNEIELGKYSRKISFNEIEANDFNLNIPRYIDSSISEDIQDLDGHLNGGIPDIDIKKLNKYWEILPGLKNEIFHNTRDGFSQCSLEINEIKSVILENMEFKNLSKKWVSVFEDWKNNIELYEINQKDVPKLIIQNISESLLKAFSNAQLIDCYDIFQILMNYWSEVMQDDIYFIVQEGWSKANSVKQILPQKDKSGKNTWNEVHDFEFNKKRYKAEVIPPKLIEKTFLKELSDNLDEMKNEIDISSQNIEIFIEEQDDEDDLLQNITNEKGKITQALIGSRKKELDSGLEEDSELKAIEEYLSLYKIESDIKKSYKKSKLELDNLVVKKYKELSEAEIKSLIIDCKWLGELRTKIIREIDDISENLVDCITVLKKRYSEPLPILNTNVDELSKKVDDHLKQMGI